MEVITFVIMTFGLRARGQIDRGIHGGEAAIADAAQQILKLIQTSIVESTAVEGKEIEAARILPEGRTRSASRIANPVHSFSGKSELQLTAE